MSHTAHSETRKFTRGLSKPGTAAELRQSVSEVVRTSAIAVSKVYSFCIAFIVFLSAFPSRLSRGYALERELICMASHLVSESIYRLTCCLLLRGVFAQGVSELWKSSPKSPYWRHASPRPPDDAAPNCSRDIFQMRAAAAANRSVFFGLSAAQWADIALVQWYASGYIRSVQDLHVGTGGSGLAGSQLPTDAELKGDDTVLLKDLKFASEAEKQLH